MEALRGAELRERLDHPIIDSDGHTLEFTPAWLDVVGEVAGRELRDRLAALLDEVVLGWYALSPSERLRRGALRPAWWATPARNTLDRATASLPRLLHERMDDLGIDFSVLYPSVGLLLFAIDDEELRRAACRGLNAYHAELHAPYADRMTPAAVIPMHTPAEAIEELRFAVGELGLRVGMLAGHVRRPVDGAPERHWVDNLGVDAAHDYDPVWRACAELRIAPTFHSSAAGWASRASTTSYVHNHLGQFAAAGEATCRSLFLDGVTRRFPELRFAFLEGGVGWACTLLSDLLGHWEKRGRDAIGDLDPRRIDAAELQRLFDSHGEPRYRERLAEPLLGTIGLHVTDEPADMIDEFARCEIERPEDLVSLFAQRFYFGCEADDPINAWAFDRRVNPLGTRLRAVFSSDIGHWDVPEMDRVCGEAWELVERGLIDADDFRDFVFGHPLALWTAQRPDFFDGTRVQGAARTALGR